MLDTRIIVERRESSQRVYLCLLHELVKTEQPHEWKPVAAETSQTDFDAASLSRSAE